jgi:magnesium-transporting ATPase (P-type)
MPNMEWAVKQFNEYPNIPRRLGRGHACLKQLGMPRDLARTLAVNTLVCGQAFYLFNSRYLHESSLSIQRLLANRMAWVAIGALTALQLIEAEKAVVRRFFLPADIRGTEGQNGKPTLATKQIGTTDVKK